ncbi:MAG TPA: carboxymuconolactone decarboxylase family protein [Gammaproteobacteria bacterium]|nr:carboxymuconolactone decarboxylase family protein [Gammaproteobacteria bacterium]
MNPRIDYDRIAPEAVKAVLELQKFVNHSSLEESLLNLVLLRVSQINGCAYCVDIHCAEARKSGESERRLQAVCIWQESPFFSDRERAALAWAEAVTLISTTHVPDAVYQEVREHFDEKSTIDLTMAVITINSWNRLAISFRKLPKK